MDSVSNNSTGQPPKPLPLNPDLVREFVTAAHHDFSAIKTMLKETPVLLNATWDWGNGDFETALGAAGHMGKKDIAEYLIEKGARVDIFAAAMLGKLDIVKSIFAAFPQMINCKGPHGISLLAHAEIGKEDSLDVVKFLTSMKIPVG